MRRLIRWSSALARRAFRVARFLALVAVLLLPYLTLGLLVLRIAVGYGAGRTRIAAALADKLGCRGTIDDSVVIYLGSTNVYGLRLYAEGEDEPFLVAGRVEADLNAVGFVRRRPIYRVDLYDAELRLRFDRDGKLLTVIRPKPGGGPLPAFRIRNGRLTIDREGSPPFTLVGVSLTVNTGKDYELLGVVDDPVWGPIDVSGSMNPKTMATRVTLRNPGLDLTPDKLATVPFVSPALWQRVELNGMKVPLEFTLWLNEKMPKVRYRARFAGVMITSKEPNRPPFTAGPAAGVLLGNEEGLTADGTIDDAQWGRWSVGIHAEYRRGAVELELSAADAIRVEQRRLVTLPYVPAVVWKQIDVKDGVTTANVRVRFNFRKPPDLRYLVELDVKRVDLNVTSVGLDVHDAVGRVRIEDNLVELRDVTARAAGGTIAGLADLDFRPKPSTLHFDVTAEGVRLRKLPAKFGIPTAYVDGRLRGKADLTVTLREGGPETTGNGTARLEEASVLGFPTIRPIELRLYEGRINVSPRWPVLRRLLHPATALPAESRATHLACRTNCLASAATGRLAAWMLRPEAHQTYLDATVALDDVDLAELLRRLPDDLQLKDLKGQEVGGKLSLRAQIGVPINTPKQFGNYAIDGEFWIDQGRVGERQVQRLRTLVDYRRGTLRLDEVAGEVGAGSFAASATAKLFPAGDLSLSVDATRLPLAVVAGRSIEGSVSGHVRASAPLASVKDLASWRGRAVLREGRLEARGVAAGGLSAEVALANSKLSVNGLRGELGGAPVSGSGSLTLTGRMPVVAEVSVAGADLGILSKSLPPSVTEYKPSGRVWLAGKVEGTLSPVALNGGGRLEARDLGAAGVLIDSLSAAVEFRDDVLSVPRIEGRLFGGTMAGSASVPLAEGAKARMTLTAADLDAGAIGRSLKLPFAMGGKIGVETKAVACREGGCWSGEVTAQTKTVAVRNFAANNVVAKLEWRDEKFDYRLGGDLLGGMASVTGTFTPSQRPSGKITLERIALRNLGAALGQEEALRQLDGVVTLVVPYDFSNEGVSPRGTGRIELRDLRLGDREVADSIAGELSLGRDGVVLRDVTSSFAGGSLRVQGAYRPRDPARSWLTINLTGADGGRLTALGMSKELITGPIDLHLRVGLGAEWAGSGSVVLSRGKVLGVEVIGWRLPIEFRFDPSQPRLELEVRESHAQVGNGRAQLDARVRWSGTWTVSGDVRFYDAGLASLAGSLGDVSSFASGRVTGRVVFGGQDMTSLSHLNATIHAKLTDTQALQLPVLNVLVPYLVPGQASTTFQTGELSAQLSRGVLRVRELALEGPLLVMFLQGTVTLAQGRLDLDVMARTNTFGLDPVVVRLLLLRVPPVGPVPVTVALRATQLLAQRTVYLRVTGTAKTPVVQVEPLRTLSDEAVRFFLGLAVSPATPLP